MANKNSIIDLEELLGLKDFDKHTLEYDLQLMINDTKEYEERQQRKEDFIELFKECYDELCIFMESDPKRRVSVNCFTCFKGMDLRDKYGRPKNRS